MILVGILGGVASGKSLVAQCFAELGAVVLDADGVGHDVLRLPGVKEQIRVTLGDGVFDQNGEINRSSLAEVVFAPDTGAASLARLEQITHPEITKRLLEEIDRLRSLPEPPPAAILDAPVMLKTNLATRCDKIVYVEAADAVRRDRAMRRGWSEDQWRRREDAQEDLAFKRQIADVVVENSCLVDDTRLRIKAIWRAWELH
jgi:dephospho-CoA kinase